MEFEKYGPLAQSKEFAETQKTSWMPVFFSLCIVILVTGILISTIQDNQMSIKIG